MRSLTRGGRTWRFDTGSTVDYEINHFRNAEVKSNEEWSLQLWTQFTYFGFVIIINYSHSCESRRMTIFKGLGRCWESIGPLRSPGKFPRPFIRHSKQIRRLLSSPLYNGQASFPTLLPFSGAGKFSLSAHPMPYAKFFTHNLSIKRPKVAFMRMWISYYSPLCTSYLPPKILYKHCSQFLLGRL